MHQILLKKNKTIIKKKNKKNSQWAENNLYNITVYGILERADGYESNFYKMYRIWDKCHLRRKKMVDIQ